jgi:hypothetical protein
MIYPSTKVARDALVAPESDETGLPVAANIGQFVTKFGKYVTQAACVHVGQVQSGHVQLLQASSQCSHWHRAWLQLGQLQSGQSHTAQESEQFAQLHAVHSS